MAYIEDGPGWYDDENDGLEDRLQEDLESIRASLNVFKVFFAFQPEITFPAPPPENEEVEWDGLNLTAKVWYELEESC